MADSVNRELACQTALAKTPVKPTAPPTTSDHERKWRDSSTLADAVDRELACQVAVKTPSVAASSPTVRDHDTRLCAVSALSLDIKLAHMRDILAEHGLSDRAFCRESDLPYVSPGVGYAGRTKRDVLNDARRAVGLRELTIPLFPLRTPLEATTAITSSSPPPPPSASPLPTSTSPLRPLSR